MNWFSRNIGYQLRFRAEIKPGAATWFCCSPVQAEWIVSNGQAKCFQPVKYLDVPVENGGPRFLLDFLKIVNPLLPFNRIIEADVALLVEELSPIFYPHEYGYDSYDELVEAEEREKKWFTHSWREGTILINLKGKRGEKLPSIRNTLAAIRLASFCTLGANLIVVDPLDAIDSFDNNYEDPSGSSHYIYTIVRLDQD